MRCFRLLAPALLLFATASAQLEPPPGPAAPMPAANDTDPSYRLAAGDSLSVNLYGEPDMSASQRLDNNGVLRLPMIGEVKLGGLTVREAEATLEKLYQSRELLKKPLVTINVSNYALREVSVLGAVRSPGNFQFPKETTSLDIADLITRLGGFTPTAKSDAVSVIRRKPDGTEEVTTVDVERMISGRRRGDSTRREFAVFPGDRIWVPERLF
ncbi:polysaccharide biosynthesis/export family protein [Opitutus terrae]|uniref:Polysaccharide export protein n=1 Tax=Opitutus terrae (strain DSM 11246 / JCM 15787 / PB90-1) TaxID=452637 RepID=B1ZT67_OPITP|nr:polysaccharide biosynthesis/export family protein [Opitutus terrae]ACB76521.1 polysaccharide export protein [Opitutus terrae PB90-1]